MYQLIASPTFKLCLKRLVHFLERKYTPEKALQIKRNIQESVTKNLTHTPLIAPLSDRLLDLCITDYRQLLVGNHNLVFFRIDETNKKVILLAVMDSRQSIQKLLSEVLLLS